jgi:hypothetical protein
MIQLGSKVRDTLTGFSGMLTGRTEWLYGCIRLGIDPCKVNKDGKPIETEWFDEQRVEVIESKKPKVSKGSKATTGGPVRDPIRVSDVRR